MVAESNPNGNEKRDIKEEEDGEDSALGRRSYLRLTGAAAAAALPVAASGRASAATTRHGISFKTVYDAVADLGMDNSGNRSIDQALARAAGNDTLIEFPPGQYLVNNTLTLSGVSNFGIVGKGGRSDVEFVTRSGNKLHWIAAREGQNLLFENFTMQQTRDRTTAFRCTWLPKHGLHVENVELAGWNPRDDTSDDPGPGIAPGATAQWGVSTVKNFKCTGGGVVDFYPSRRTPIWLGQSHHGEVRFVDCHVEESGSHTLYASRTPGVVRVEGGLYKNNDNTNLRVSAGGHPNKKSSVRGATIVCDTSDVEHLPDGERYQNMRGIRVESRKYGHAGLLIEDCDFVYENAPHSSAIIDISSTHGGATVRNCRFQSHVNGIPYIRANAVDWNGPYGQTDVDGPSRVIVEGCSFTGNASNTHGTVQISGRNGSIVRNCCFERPHDDGVVMTDCQNAAVVDSTINVGGRAVVRNNSSVRVSGISYSGSCPLPTPYDNRAGSTDLPNVITIHGDNGPATYDLSVTGELARSTADGATIDDNDAVDGAQATGRVNVGKDSYAFSGDIAGFSTEGNPSVYLNGTEVDPAELGPLPNTLVVDGTDLTERAHYEFSVSGDLEKGVPGGAEANDNDTVQSGTASGQVLRGKDGYTFEGTLTSLSVDGNARVYVNGDRVTPDDIGPLSNMLVVDGPGDGQVASYTFTVSGELRKGEQANRWDTVEGTTATGQVGGAADSYTFDGDLTALSVDGDATVSVNGQPVDPASVGDLPNTLVVDFTGVDERAHYELSVSGELRKADSADPNDDVSGGTASGQGLGGTDAFAFDGEITNFTVDREVRVLVNGSETDLGTPAPSLPPRRVTVANHGGDRTDYRFSVDGAVRTADPTADADLGDGTASASVWAPWTDEYTVEGSIQAFELEDLATVTVDRANRTIRVDGNSTDGAVRYRLAVSGELRKGEHANNWDSVEGSTATGQIGGAADTFTYDGEITELAVEDSVTVDVSPLDG